MHNKEFTSCGAAVAGLAHDLITALRAAKETNTPTLFLYSGGSNMSVYNQLQADVLGSHLTICALDDRFDESGEHSNAVQFMSSSWYGDLRDSGTHFIDTRVHEGEEVGAWTLRTRTSIDNWLQKNSENRNIIATIGIGDDGHIAGIVPQDNEHRFSELFNGPEHVVSYEVIDQPFLHRLTATFTLLAHITHGFVLACGKNDIAALSKSENAPAHVVPAHFLRTQPVADTLTLYSSASS